MTTFQAPARKTVRPDGSVTTVFADWSPTQALTMHQMQFLLLNAKEELIHLEELKSELERVKKDLKVQQDRNISLAERCRRQDELLKQPTKEMLLRAAPVLKPTAKKRVLRKDEKTGKWS